MKSWIIGDTETKIQLHTFLDVSDSNVKRAVSDKKRMEGDTK